jgi:hypothetical protein
MSSVTLSEEARSFWYSLNPDTRGSFRASVLMDLQLRATLEQEPIKLYPDPDSQAVLVHPCLELEPCPGCSLFPCSCP